MRLLYDIEKKEPGRFIPLPSNAGAIPFPLGHRGFIQSFTPGSLYIVAARPSMGKTSLAINMAMFASLYARQPTLFFSLEMGQADLLIRVLAMETGIDSVRIADGSLSEGEEAKCERAYRALKGVPLYVDDRSRMSVDEVCGESMEAVREYGTKAIFVDYMQLLRGDDDSKRMSREREVSYISQQLKALAKEAEVPVIALSQLNRNVEGRNDKRPQPGDLRDSGSIEQDADVILFVYREAMHDLQADPTHAELICAKNRNGPTGILSLYFEPATTSFFNVELI